MNELRYVYKVSEVCYIYSSQSYHQTGNFVKCMWKNFLFPKYVCLTHGVVRTSSILGTLHVRFFFMHTDFQLRVHKMFPDWSYQPKLN